ncbi:MAG: hypothetical protein CALGDGBN_00824 [Pseudomonadales bacterium]|nr:hypothetical protein [Pseudomonadales bacterium]
MMRQLADRWPLTPPQTLTAFAVALTVLGIAWQLRALSTLTVPAPPTDPLEPAAPLERDELAGILAAELFGAAAAPGNAARSGDALVQSSAGLTLRAALAPTGAVLEAADGEARWYPVGSTVGPGAQLQEVRRDHVVLLVQGRQERLGFPAIEDSGTPAALPAAEAATLPSLPSAPAATDGAVPIPAHLPAEEKARLVRQRLEELRNRSRQ